MMGWTRPVALVNARVVADGGLAASVRFDTRVLGVDVPPEPKDVVVDLEGAYVLPGLVNAHDHLELNHYGRIKPRERYVNAAEWIADLRPLLTEDESIVSNKAHALADRIFIGGLKNLLSGVTTVAHHNPRYREVDRASPVRVVRRYGWAHSLALEHAPVGARGEKGGDIRERYIGTPDNAPFILHSAEGVDGAAASEFCRLDQIGCVGPNTVLVHGVGFSVAQWRLVLERGASLAWCPASNHFLFERTIPVREFLDASPTAQDHLCLATDSRVTGTRDMLEELRFASAAPVTSQELLRMVTTAPARILRVPDAGRIAVGGPADLLVIPPVGRDASTALVRVTRGEVLLVTIAGRPLVASLGLEPLFRARKHTPWRVVIDGRERLADARLARTIKRCPIQEQGVDV